jgi:pimeloyl-ACP methyl ester carboxylesterase
VREALLVTLLEGLRQGGAALVEDYAIEGRAWGFELARIEVPVLLWHGAHDLFVPIAHGRWLAERLPEVEAHLSDDDGHLTLTVRRVPEVLAWLAARFQA